MSFYADLHIHSKYSRATSRDCDLENLTFWARKKGITVVGTGDFTHPAWFKELQEKLVPAEPGLFRLRPDLEKSISEKLPKSCQGKTHFMLSVEISTIYKKGDKVRKIHHLVYAPTFEKAGKIRQALEKIGNIHSDGRPILGLDSRHLLEIVLQAGEDCYLVPAHIWTPWFAVLGSKSGFDDVAHCYGDLSQHVFAVETGLSSDPEMNWKISSLDRYRLMSNSDAHSPQKLGREVNLFNTELDYYAMLKSLQTGKGYGGTLEFFPEEGKYHMDGHRSCGVKFSPEESKEHHGICPKCHKPLTLGVLYRVEELADRHDCAKPAGAADFKSVIPLPEVISEILQSGPASQKVSMQYDGLLNKLGSEIDILNRLPLDEIQKGSSSLVREAIERMRSGKVIREAGYDGEYGRIKLFQDGELKTQGAGGVLFDVPVITSKATQSGLPIINKLTAAPKNQIASPQKTLLAITKRKDAPPQPAAVSHSALDPYQAKALEMLEGPVLITAGPGSGKTRVLTHRVAHLIQSGHAKPEECLTITFTRRAAQEMKDRLQKLLPEQWKQIPVLTFHGLGLKILQEERANAGLPRGFRAASERERLELLKEKLAISDSKAEKILREISIFKRNSSSLREGPEGRRGNPSSEIALVAPRPRNDGRQPQVTAEIISKDKLWGNNIKDALNVLAEARETQGWLDYDDLILDAVKLLEEHTGLRAHYRQKFPFVSVDEYQDIDALQYRLIQLLVPANGNLLAIGDPDQSIYSFRGANVEFFMRFKNDFPDAREIHLLRNYRSGEILVSASNQMMAPEALVEDREMEALLEDPGKILIHESSTDKAEAEYIAHCIEQMIGGLSFYSIDTNRTDAAMERDFAFSDFAVLYRTEQQAFLIEEALERAGIPFERHSHRPLGEHPRVQAYLSLIKSSPVKEGLLDALYQAKLKLQEAAPDEKDGIYEKLEAIALRAGEKKEVFLSEVYLGEELELWDPRADRVSLLTLHAAKGLEFPAVFITGCEKGFIPLVFGNETSEDSTAEERRLFYVGMTRAKERLILSHSKKRFIQGKSVERETSPFLKDIERRLVEKSKAIFKAKRKNPQMELF